MFTVLCSVLSLFTIVSWKQGPCTSTAGTNGTCYSSNECTNLGGEEVSGEIIEGSIDFIQALHREPVLRASEFVVW